MNLFPSLSVRLHSSAAFLLLLSLPLCAEDNAASTSAASPAGPVPSFNLIGDVGQTVYETAPDWGQAPGSSWTFTSDLKPKFTYGPVTFVADTAWILPMTASLTYSTVQATIYEAYFRITPVANIDLTFGQKHYNIGVGQAVTVGDSINPVTGFFDQKTGFRGATAEWSPNSATSVSAALSTENSDLTGAGQVSLLLDKLQLTASLVSDGQKAKTFNPAVGTSYDFSGVIVSAEGAAEFLPQGPVPTEANPSAWSAPAAWTSPALSGSAGARYTLTVGDWDYTLSGQYLHWGQGWTTDQTNDWNSASAKYGAPRPLFPVRSQENAILQFSAVSGTTWNLSTLAVVDLQDQSFIGQAKAEWDPWDNVELDLSFLLAQGTSGSTYQYLPEDPLLNLTSPQSRYQVSFSTTYHF
jgi:hypothetical protein